MLLRRVTQHVKTQNWFAVFIDFLIVVIGILIAFQITNWSESQKAKTNLANAENTLKTDLFTIYFNAQERLALTECRIASLRQLGEQLLEPTISWQGISLLDETNDGRLAFDAVLKSPNRDWVSAIWDAELARGTFNKMSGERRAVMDFIFSGAKHAQTLNDSIHVNQAKLKVLVNSMELSQSDRLRYFDVVAAIDQEGAGLENASAQIVDRIESLDLKFDKDVREFFRGVLAEHNSRSDAIYGECRKPMHIPFILEPVSEAK